MPLLSPETSARLGELQTLDDAIAFRLARLNLPCEDCAAGQKCDDHARDVELIEGYQERYGSVFSDALAAMDPDDIEQVMQPGDGTPPTVALLSAAVLSRLRELAADGPVRMNLDGRDVMIELEDGVIVETPIAGSDGEAVA